MAVFEGADMLELVQPHAPMNARNLQPQVPAHHVRFEPAWEELDEAHGAIWEAVRHLFPAHAMADQADYGCLLVSWALKGGRKNPSHFAAPVIIRIEPGLLLALWTCDEESRRDIAALQAEIVSDALATYDPHSRVPSCGVICLGE